MAVFPESSLRSPNRTPRKVSWDVTILDNIVARHNSKPPKGNFYKSRKLKSGKKYVPFSQEDLRLRGVLARKEATLLRENVF